MRIQKKGKKTEQVGENAKQDEIIFDVAKNITCIQYFMLMKDLTFHVNMDVLA